MKQGISASRKHFRGLNTKEVLITRRDEEFVLLVANGVANYQGKL